MERTDFTLTGHAGQVRGCTWSAPAPRYLAVLAHGYGEHVRRYDWAAARLVEHGACVSAADHVGHGRSDGDRVLIEDVERVVDDLHVVVEATRAEHPRLPLVLIGHSMGGLIAARYVQRFGADVCCLVLSGPVLGRWAALDGLARAQVIPDEPIDPATLSRDPLVGAAYVADPLVWHGPFKRPTVLALRDMLERIAADGPSPVPTLWLHGDEDRLVPIEGTAGGWARFAPDSAQARRYPGARHEIFNETNRDEVLADVVAFVEEHLPRD